MNAIMAGPEFQIESDRAVLLLGNSERKEVGELWARTLDELGYFQGDIVIKTLNRAADPLGRLALRRLLKESTLITHSGGITRARSALQVVAFNPPEPVPARVLLKKAGEVAKDPVKKEPGAHKTGAWDLTKAGLQLISSPISSVRTVRMIARGYSATARLIDGEADFPAGRAMIHSELDGFGFAQLADIPRAAEAGVTTALVPGHYHNEVLFAPRWTIRMLPEIFPPTR